MPGPLHGIRIVDLTAVVSGPFATLHLADMGADVIKVEPPEGDVMRNPGTPPTKGMGPIFLAANRNKRSICLDLKRPEAVDAVKRLAATADVFVHNNRPQAIERLGLGYDDIRAINPGIVYAYCLGYKRSGPYGAKPAYDDLVQGASGAAMLSARAYGGEPRFLPSLIVDKTTGTHLAMAILGALFHRARTGRGQLVEVPMLETITAFWLTEHLYDATYDPPRGPIGYTRVLNPHRRPSRSKDGYVCMLIVTDRHWNAFCTNLDREDLRSDPRLSTIAARANHQPVVQQIVNDLAPSRTTAEWLAFCDAHDIPAMPVNDLDDLLDDSHLKETGFFTTREHPTEGPVRVMASPLGFSETPTEFRNHAGFLGADGPDILRAAGYSDGDIADLEAGGVLRVVR
jgi:crotonobetainyl-CoA:carnitine CoA-transferase CaiB-like acyl-CoA transferase